MLLYAERPVRRTAQLVSDLLAAVGDVATGWRQRDRDVIEKLATHELARHGLLPS